MLRWEQDRENCWFAYDDDTIAYRVFKSEDSCGWEWDFLLEATVDGMDGYDTFEEAKADVKKDWKHVRKMDREEKEEEKGYTLEETDEILGDLLYEERKEELMGW